MVTVVTMLRSMSTFSADLFVNICYGADLHSESTSDGCDDVTDQETVQKAVQ
jgi:hypothetical protein